MSFRGWPLSCVVVVIVLTAGLAAMPTATASGCLGDEVECPIGCDPTDVGELLARPVQTLLSCIP